MGACHFGVSVFKIKKKQTKTKTSLCFCLFLQNREENGFYQKILEIPGKSFILSSLETIM